MSGLSDLVNESGSLEPPKLDEAVGVTPNAELMAQARMTLSGIWGMSILGYVLYFVLAMCVSVFAFASVAFVTAISAASGSNTETAVTAIETVTQLADVLLSGAFTVGFCSFFLVVAQEGEARLECLFTGFKRFWKSFGVYFFYALFIMLWSLLFIVPGIIAAFSYAMAFFVVADVEDVGVFEALSRSKEMMKGNRWKFFCLNFRFIGWSILCLFTFGIGYLWLVPYMQTSFAQFYEDIK